MKKMVMGYVSTLAGAFVGLLTLASMGGNSPNYLVTAVLALVTLTALGVGWYGLSAVKEPAS